MYRYIDRSKYRVSIIHFQIKNTYISRYHHTESEDRYIRISKYRVFIYVCTCFFYSPSFIRIGSFWFNRRYFEMTESKYCLECRRKHPSHHWYGIGDVNFCHFRMRECNGKEASYAIPRGACMRIPCWSQTKQVLVFARLDTAWMY